MVKFVIDDSFIPMPSRQTLSDSLLGVNQTSGNLLKRHSAKDTWPRFETGTGD